jgi:tripeptide aminopeptidase
MALRTKTAKAPEPNLAAAVKRVMTMMAIPGKSGEEGGVVAFIRRELESAGAPAEAIQTDRAHAKSPLGGETGNLILRLPGTFKAPRRLLMAHMDTVPLCVGCRPVRRGAFVRSADPDTALGADDRAGATAVLTAAVEILRRGLPHPPLVFFWPVQEEVGLLGARHASLALLGKPRLAFNWDGGPAEKITVGATGAYRLEIEIRGIASHAGGAPEQGVSAIGIAGLAIADLVRGGWHGDVRKAGKHGTSNVGVIAGGDATNVVTPRVRVRAECRSHDADFRRKLLGEIEESFRRAAREVKNAQGNHGQVTIESRQDYEAFRLSDREPCVAAAQQAARQAGLDPFLAVSNGGLDANWMTAHGIPTVTLGCGQKDVHTTAEALDVTAFESACRIALCLATASESAAQPG